MLSTTGAVFQCLLWSALPIMCSPATVLSPEAFFLLTNATHCESASRGSVALLSLVICPAAEKVELDRCLLVASKLWPFIH